MRGKLITISVIDHSKYKRCYKIYVLQNFDCSVTGNTKKKPLTFKDKNGKKNNSLFDTLQT